MTDSNSKPPADDRLLLPAEDAAKVLSISERHLWTLTRTKRVPCVRLGRRVLYPRAKLEEWVKEQAEEASS